MFRKLLSSLLLAGAAAALPAAAGDVKCPVYCGSFTCFQIHAPAGGKDADARASVAIDVINKYLGGAVGRVSTKPQGKNVRLLLNSELVVLVTPADAQAEHLKSPAALAAKWSHSLSQAFESTKARLK